MHCPDSLGTECNPDVAFKKSNINNLCSHLRKQEKGEQNQPKTSRRKEIIKERGEKLMKLKTEKLTETKSGFFEKSSNIENLPSRPMKEKGTFPIQWGTASDPQASAAAGNITDDPKAGGCDCRWSIVTNLRGGGKPVL